MGTNLNINLFEENKLPAAGSKVCYLAAGGRRRFFLLHVGYSRIETACVGNLINII